MAIALMEKGNRGERSSLLAHRISCRCRDYV